MNSFSPMLSRDFCQQADTARWPADGMLISQKYDGIRIVVRDNEVWTRSGKLLQNRAIAEVLKLLPAGFDGELLPNDFFARDCFQQATTIAMTKTPAEATLGPQAEGWRFVVFNYFGDGSQEFRSKPYTERLALGSAFLKDAQGLHAVLREHVCMAPQAKATTYEQAAVWTETIVWLGAEGAMLTHAQAPYAYSRCKNSELWSLKLKPMARCEATIVGFEPAYYRGAKAIAQGLAGRAKEELGALVLNSNVFPGATFKCGTGFSQEQRQTIWLNKARFVGQTVAIDYMPAGSKNAPRHPSFKGFRHADDM